MGLFSRLLGGIGLGALLGQSLSVASDDLFLPSSGAPLPHHRTGGQRAHRAWKKRRAAGRA